MAKLSLPAWERGLKSVCPGTIPTWMNVAPCVGAWIEIPLKYSQFQQCFVAPCVGAWIEIRRHDGDHRKPMSLPAWERGLK